MSLCSRSLLWKAYRATVVRQLSTATQSEAAPGEQIKKIRISETNPAFHTTNDISKLYVIPEETRFKLFKYGGLPKTFRYQVETFKECAILIRRPAIEIMSYMQRADYKRPVNKYVLYGKHGTGKSLTLLHLIHYAALQEFVVVHVPWVNVWFRFPEEVTASEKLPGHVDISMDAAEWLIAFQKQNDELLSKLDLKVSKTYEWSPREQTLQGTPVKELISFGIGRVKHATAILSALIDELKMASTAGKCKTFVAIDGYNSFWSDYTNILDDAKKIVPAQKITLTTPFLNITKADWCNGAIVLVVDVKATKERRDSYLPRYLLGKEGFEYLDPFVPVAVEKYTSDEFHTIIDYYKDRKWIRNISPDGELEIELLTHKNPAEILQYCDPL